MKISFETDYPSILEKIKQIDPIKYGQTRNYIDGDVSYLSPYISRGVISTSQVLENVLSRGYALHQIESFVKELCWRDYFQSIAQLKDLNTDLKHPQTPVLHQQIPKEIVQANTGIEGIDLAISELMASGYMHNHCRMYTASLVCNMGQSYWKHPAQWMYYHLLDGDWASNACSWQWLAGANSSKKYYFNQENLNTYCRTHQKDTFIDLPYENLTDLEVPLVLQKTVRLDLKTALPPNTDLNLDPQLPSCIYNYYNLDPSWMKEVKANRILLLEPQFFAAYPVSEKCLQFCIDLSQNIPNIQVHVGSFDSLCKTYKLTDVHYKEHPFNQDYRGTATPRDWIIENTRSYFPSFFAYWKKARPILLKRYQQA